MRIDKYLWCTRYYKTRSIATEACKKGHIKLDGANVKPSKEVFSGEKLTIRKDPGAGCTQKSRRGKISRSVQKRRDPSGSFSKSGFTKIFKGVLSQKRNGQAYQKRPPRHRHLS